MQVYVLTVKNSVSWVRSGVFIVNLSRFYTLRCYFDCWLWNSKCQLGGIYSHDLHFAKYAIRQTVTSAKQRFFLTSSKSIQVFILCIYNVDTKHKWTSNAVITAILMKSSSFSASTKLIQNTTKSTMLQALSFWWTVLHFLHPQIWRIIQLNQYCCKHCLLIKSSSFSASTKLIQNTNKPIMLQALSFWWTVLYSLHPQSWYKTQPSQ